MKPAKLHFFEFRQMILDSPCDKSMQAKLDKHLTECQECRGFMSLLQVLHNESASKRNRAKGSGYSNSELIDKVKQRIQHKGLLSGILNPLSGIAWIIVTFDCFSAHLEYHQLAQQAA